MINWSSIPFSKNMIDSILISRNTRLTFKLTAKEIYISNEGDVTITTEQIGPNAPCPNLSLEYLESLCCDFYYGGKPRPHAIADILLLNRLLSTKDYGDFYDRLNYNLDNNNLTIISSQIFR